MCEAIQGRPRIVSESASVGFNSLTLRVLTLLFKCQLFYSNIREITIPSTGNYCVYGYSLFAAVRFSSNSNCLTVPFSRPFCILIHNIVKVIFIRDRRYISCHYYSVCSFLIFYISDTEGNKFNVKYTAFLGYSLLIILSIYQLPVFQNVNISA